jgi:hypothetical protein
MTWQALSVRRYQRAGADALQVGLVPVERGERRAELRVLVVVQQALQLHAIVRYAGAYNLAFIRST